MLSTLCGVSGRFVFVPSVLSSVVGGLKYEFQSDGYSEGVALFFSHCGQHAHVLLGADSWKQLAEWRGPGRAGGCGGGRL